MCALGSFGECLTVLAGLGRRRFLSFLFRDTTRVSLATARSVRARHPSNFMRDVPTSPKISVFRMRPWHKSSNDSRECCLLRRDPGFYRPRFKTLHRLR